MHWTEQPIFIVEHNYKSKKKTIKKESKNKIIKINMDEIYDPVLSSLYFVIQVSVIKIVHSW